MAHGQQRKGRILAASLFTMAAPAFALSLGDAAVRSNLGEGLDVRFPVKIERGESIEPSCFQLGSGGAVGVPHLPSGSVSLERSAAGTMLRLRSAAPVTEPALAVEIIAKCPGQENAYRREYTLLVAPRGGPAPAKAPATSPAPAAASPLLPSIATLIARIGDTLDSIAEAIFPRNRAARRAYIEALRTSNPPLATLGENEPIPLDTPIALPDLRSFSQRQHAAHTQAQRTHAVPREAPGAQVPPPISSERAEATPAPRARPRPKPSAETPGPAPMPRSTASPRPTEAPAPRAARGDFVLKLSSGEVDLTRSRGVDEKSRARLRERLTILDADDQVAALLALRHSVKQLETQVADLQLKLSGMPSSFPPPREEAKAPPAPAAPEPVKPVPVPVPAPAPVPSPSSAAPVGEPAPAVTAAPITVPAPTPPQSEAKPAEAAPPVPARDDASRPKPALPGVQATPWMDYGLWALAIAFLVIAIVLGLRLVRRSRESRGWEEPEEAAAAEPAIAHDDNIIVAEEPMPGPDPAAPARAPARREIDSDVALPTRLPSNTEDLRQRYIEERFPEIGKGAIVLDDPASVVKGARLFYEDGALARAVELLHYAIERHPAELKAWLALFEIYRLEGLSGEFAQLATRFREQHGASEYWRKVQYFGREIDPGNALYAAAPIDSFQTIGPAQAKRLAADSAVDPIAENWLGAPMDFENEVLANELRKTLMADAGINEQDLVPNPMPALRNVEMFSVA